MGSAKAKDESDRVHKIASEIIKDPSRLWKEIPMNEKEEWMKAFVQRLRDDGMSEKADYYAIGDRSRNFLQRKMTTMRNPKKK